MRTKLTAKAVERHKAPTKTGKQALIWDTELKGFGLLLSGKTSSKTFIVQRDLPGGKTRRVTIGSVAEIDLAKAREEAAGIIHSMRQGHDPKHKSAGDITLREALEAYLAAEDAGRAEGCSSSVSTACPTKGQVGLYRRTHGHVPLSDSGCPRYSSGAEDHERRKGRKEDHFGNNGDR